MLTTVEKPKLFRTVGRAWRSLFQALRRMAPLFVIAYILLAGLNIALDRAPALLAIPARDAMKQTLTDGRSLPALNVAKAMGLDIVSLLLRAVIIAPLAVAMHRFILLGETRRFYLPSRLSLRFAAWLAGLQSLVLILWWLILFATGATGLPTLLEMLLFAVAIFLIQTMPLFPSIAVEENSASVSSRLESALERAEKVFLLTVGTLVVTLLPLIVVQAIAVKAFAKLAAKLPLLAPLAQAAAGLILTALVATVISFIYSYTVQRPRAEKKSSAVVA